MFEKLTSLFGSKPSAQAAKAAPASSGAQLTPEAPPVARTRDMVAIPSFFKIATPSPTARLLLKDRSLLSTDITTYRQGDTRTALADFIAASPDLSSAVFSYIRTAVTAGYVAVAKNPDGSFNPDGTALAQQMLSRFDMLTDYSDGFAGISSMRSNSESLAKELMTYGACSAELVLGKDRLPRRIQPISVPQIKFLPDGKVLKPVQLVGGVPIDLDIPTFFYLSLDQVLLEPYSESPLEAALKPVVSAEDFQNDIRRIVKRVIHPRMEVVIDEGKFLSALPAASKKSEETIMAARTSTINDLTGRLSNLNPEDALVYFDSLGIKLLNNGNSSLSQEYQVLSSILDAKLSTGAKAMPAILGHGSQSANIASTETMLFAKAAEGAVQFKLNELYSRILTLAVRLFGLDVIVEFKYDSVDLRPQSELEAFKQTKQSRLLELLSLGIMTDDEVSLQLTGRLPPAGYKPLSGTMFKAAIATGVSDPTTNGGSALNQGQQSDQPAQGRGQNNKSDPQKFKSVPGGKS